MKKFIFLSFLSFLIPNYSFSQTDTVKKVSPWKINGNTSLNFVQSSFSYWAAGGNNSVAGTASGKFNLVYKKEKVNWESNLELAYGLTFLEGEKRKNDDKIDFATKFGYEAFKNWNYSGLVTFKSQFDRGYASYPVDDPDKYNSKFFAPAYLVLSVGLDYRPNDNTSLMISPISAKFTFINDDYLVDAKVFSNEGEKFLSAWGALIRSTYNKKVHQNILLSSTLELFSNLLDSPENITINWELKFDFNITKFIKSNFYTQLMYDDMTKTLNSETGKADNGAKVQFKQVLGIGFSFIF